jgi:hypothetical protein
MSWVAVAVGGASLIGGVAGSLGSKGKKTTGIGRTVGAYSSALKSYYPDITSTLFDVQQRGQPAYADLQARELARLQPGVAELLKNANPEEAALLQKMLGTANASDLEYGAPLPPKLLRLTNQMSRQGQAARGMGFGPADVYGETGDAARLAADLVDRERSFAMDAAHAGYSFQTDPILRMLYGQQANAANAFASPAAGFSLISQQPVARTASTSSDLFGGLMGGGLSLLGSGVKRIPAGTATTSGAPAGTTTTANASYAPYMNMQYGGWFT